jgi:hypothetical protein
MPAASIPEGRSLPEPRVATAYELSQLNEIIAGLQRRVEGLQALHVQERQERHPTFETESSYREASYAPSNYTFAPNKPKLKASDLPKFSGKDNEDVDQWIEKVSAIYEYSGVHDSDLLQQLPLVLQGNALTWFTQLGTTGNLQSKMHSICLTIEPTLDVNAFIEHSESTKPLVITSPIRNDCSHMFSQIRLLNTS